MQTITSHNDQVTSVIYLKKQNAVVSGSLDCSVKMFNCSDTQLDEDTEETIYDHDNQITCMAASGNQDILAIGDLDGVTIVFDIEKRSKLHIIDKFDHQISRILFTTSNNLLIASENSVMFCESTGMILS